MVRAELRAHTRVLNALRETQVEQGRAIAELRADVTGLRGNVTGLRAEFVAQTAEMRTGFATMAAGMADITTLLHRALDD